VSWDRDYNAAYQRRLKALRDIRMDKSGETLAALKVFYVDHPIQFIEDWMVTYDPRQKIPTMPFLLFPKQKEYIEWLDGLVTDRENGLVEKARDGGYTWCSCAWATHRWLFYHGQAIGFGSRKEDLVDRIGVSDSIMEKVRILIRNLPKEFRPDGYNERKHAGFLKILHPYNGSAIIGEAGDNIGRGGRTTIYFKDESAHYERPEKIEAALSENTDVQVDISSVNGEGNVFHRRRFSGEVRVFVHDWRDDPRKTQEWYDKRKQKARAEGLEHIFAQEIDRDYAAAVEGIFIPSIWVKAAVDFLVTPSGIIQAGLDPDDEGKDGKAMVFRHGVRVLSCKHWHEGDTTETAREARREALEKKAQMLVYDATGVGAGIKGELNSLARENNEVLPYLGVHNASTELPGNYEDTERKNKDLFANVRAMNMWKLRRRFEKTYEVVCGIAEHPEGQLISIPNDPDLISEISRPKRESTGSGKILVESKLKMRTRGVPSPNRLDALCLAFHDTGAGFFGGGAWA
jgi:phage terminase large subunit